MAREVNVAINLKAETKESTRAFGSWSKKVKDAFGGARSGMNGFRADLSKALPTLSAFGKKTDEAKEAKRTLGESLERSSEQFGRASSAMLLAQGATSQFAGEMAGAANVVASVAGMIGTGGKFGVAMGVAAGAIALGTKAWDEYKKISIDVSQLQDTFSANILRTARAAQEQVAAVDELRLELKLLGKEGREKEIAQMKMEIALHEQTRAAKEEEARRLKLLAIQFETAALKANDWLVTLGVLNREEVQHAKFLEKTAGVIESQLRSNDARSEQMKERIKLLEQLEAREKSIERAEEARNSLAEKNAKAQDEAWKQWAEVMNAREQREVDFTQKYKSLMAERGKFRDQMVEAETRANLQLAEMRKADMQKRTAEMQKIAVDARSFATSLTNTLVSSAFAQRDANDQMVDAQDEMRQALRDTSVSAEEQAVRIEAAQGKIDAAQQASAEASKATVKGVVLATIQAMEKVILARAAAAGATVGADAAIKTGFPAGPIIGAAVGAAMFGVIKGFIARMNTGGVVQKGGSPGRDTVPVMLTEGEQVMSRPERAGVASFFRRLVGEREAGRIMGAADSSGRKQMGSQVTIVNNMRTWKPNRVEEMRMARDLSRSTRKLQSLGVAT